MKMLATNFIVTASLKVSRGFIFQLWGVPPPAKWTKQCTPLSAFHPWVNVPVCLPRLRAHTHSKHFSLIQQPKWTSVVSSSKWFFNQVETLNAVTPVHWHSFTRRAAGSDDSPLKSLFKFQLSREYVQSVHISVSSTSLGQVWENTVRED